MNEASRLIKHRVTLEVAGVEGPVSTEAELRYDPTDPYAVTVAFDQGDTEVAWVFGRSLLMKGISAPAGEGEVRVFPSIEPDGRAVVGLLLISPYGEALAKLSNRDVVDFLAHTTRAVWPGTESEYLSTDDAIAAILVSG